MTGPRKVKYTKYEYYFSRISILETFARQVGFYLKEEIKFVMFTPEGGLLFEEISKSNIDRMRFEAHECLIFLWFKKEGK